MHVNAADDNGNNWKSPSPGTILRSHRMARDSDLSHEVTFAGGQGGGHGEGGEGRLCEPWQLRQIVARISVVSINIPRRKYLGFIFSFTKNRCPVLGKNPGGMATLTYPHPFRYRQIILRQKVLNSFNVQSE